MKRILKNTSIIILSAIIFAIAGFIFADKSAIEKKIVFKPSKEVNAFISDLADKAEIKSFMTKDGLKLSYVHINGNSNAKNKPKILFCKGYDTNITFEKIQKKWTFLAEKGYEIFAIDYRGYGQSEGSPDEYGLYSDVSSFLSYLAQTAGITPEDLVIWGHSLGAAVAIETAKNFNFKGVIEEGGFTSVNDMRTFRIENDDLGNPASNFIRNLVYNSMEISQKFSSKDKVSQIESPMLIMHAKNDSVVPYEMGVTLSELKPDAMIYFSEAGGHDSVGWQDNAILNFLRRISSEHQNLAMTQ